MRPTGKWVEKPAGYLNPVSTAPIALDNGLAHRATAGSRQGGSIIRGDEIDRFYYHVLVYEMYVALVHGLDSKPG